MTETPRQQWPDQLSQRLLQQRILVLGQEVDDDICNKLCGELLLLAADDPKADVTLYINSPGGSVSAGMALYDMMQFIPCDVATVAMGFAASMGQFLLCAGAPGKRYALPNARILLHQPATEGCRGQSSDLEIQAGEILRMRDQQEEILARHTGRTPLEIRKDIERDRIFTAEQARTYHLIDDIYASRKRTLTPTH